MSAEGPGKDEGGGGETETPMKNVVETETTSNIGDNGDVPPSSAVASGTSSKADSGIVRDDADSQISDCDDTGTQSENNPPVEKAKACLGCPFAPLASTAFWRNDGLFIIGIVLGTAIFVNRKLGFMVKQWSYQEGEGRIVSKFLVVLMFAYMYSFVKMGLELFYAYHHGTKLMFPKIYAKLDKLKHDYPAFVLLGDVKCARVVTIPICALIGVLMWDTVWILMVCKSHHDRSCKKSFVGTWLYDYRAEACRDGKSFNAICEKLISFIPMIVLTIATTVMGNCILPNLNDYLHGKINVDVNKSFRSRGTKMSKLSTIGELTEDTQSGDFSDDEDAETFENKGNFTELFDRIYGGGAVDSDMKRASFDKGCSPIPSASSVSDQNKCGETTAESK